LDISTDWTLVLQKEVSAQEDLVQHLNIPMSIPVSPTTTRGTTPTHAEQQSALAKGQLGFIDMFAEPLWHIGAELFFPGMQIGLRQMHANRAVWLSKVLHPEGVESKQEADTVQSKHRPTMDEATSSVSTMTGTTKSDTMTTPESGIRKMASSSELNGSNGKPTRMRKERSFSSLMFWKKKGRQAVFGE